MGNDQNFSLPGDLRDDPFLPGRGLADRVVEGEGTVEDAAADLAPVGHLAKSGRVERRGQVGIDRLDRGEVGDLRSEEQPSELQSLMRISYAVFCIHKKNTQ